MSQDKPAQPLRILVLRAVDGAGGGADSIILRTASTIDPAAFQMRLCFLRHRADQDFIFEDECRKLGLDYRQVLHRGPLDLQTLPRIRDQVHQFRPDIVHSHDYKANFYNLAVRRAKFGRVSTSHGWTGHGFRERFIYYPVDKRILNRFDLRIAVSDQIRDELLQRGASERQTRVLLNGIDCDSFIDRTLTRDQARAKLGLAADQLVIGAVGRIEKQKRFDLLLRAFEIIRRSSPNAKLVIAGDGSLKPQIENLATQMDLASSCLFLGHRTDINRIYLAFDVLAQASDYEGTPTVLVEAMALEVPIVATDAGGTTQLIVDGEHGFIVPCGVPDKLAEAIRKTLSDPSATRRRVFRARQRMEKDLSFRSRTNRLSSFYHEVHRAILSKLDQTNGREG